jgi:hypothetical protein
LLLLLFFTVVVAVVVVFLIFFTVGVVAAAAVVVLLLYFYESFLCDRDYRYLNEERFDLIPTITTLSFKTNIELVKLDN